MSNNSHEQGITRLSPRLILVPREEAYQANACLILEGESYALLRRCPGARTVFVKNGNFHDLTDEDHEILNERCDNREGPGNAAVKSNIAAAFKKYFGDMAMNLYEIGCGKYPIRRYFSHVSGLAYHAIERDHRCHEEVQKMGLSVSDWGGIDPRPLRAKQPTFCVGVYSLHFMIDADLPKRILDLTSAHEFYVGNRYLDPVERKCGDQGRALSKVLHTAGLAFERVADPCSKNNEYLVIGRSRDQTTMGKFTRALWGVAQAARRSGLG